MAECLVLSFDIGTQSTKAQLIDRFGNALASAVRRYAEPYRSPQPSWAEQDGEFYFEAICETARELNDKYPVLFSQVDCAVMTVLRDSFLCLDKDYRPLTPCILWMDQRMTKNPPALPPRWAMAVKLARMEDSADFMRRKSLVCCLKENKPEIWAKTAKYVALSTYLNYRICGRLADSTASLVGRIPFDYKNRCWDKSGLARVLYDIPPAQLCELVAPGTKLGGVTEECSALSGIPAGLPLLAAGSDKGCETLGLGVLSEGTAALSFGTCCTVEFASRKYFEPIPFFPSYPAIPEGTYNAETQLFRGYWMLRWFIDNFAQKEVQEAAMLGCKPEELLNLHLAEIPAGSGGLMMLPQWTPSITTPNAMGAFIGFSDYHSRYHCYRAIIEGLNFGLLDGLRSMEKRGGQKITLLRVSGGGSNSEEICRITADLFGLPVERIQTGEACALGAAICAFVSMGVYGSYREAVENMVHVRDCFNPDEKTHAVYEKLYAEVYTHYASTLSPLHRKLRALL